VRTFTIKNFEQFQNFRNPNPPWIKVYRSLWADPAFFDLPDAAKAHLLGLYSLASHQRDGKIPDNPKWLAHELRATEPINLKLLISLGFLIPTTERQPDVDDSFTFRQQDVALEKSREETEESREESPSGFVQLTLDADPQSSPNGKVEGPTPDDLVEGWNDLCAPMGLVRVAELSVSRRKQAALRLREHPEDEFWNAVFTRIRGSPFLCGLKPKPGHEHWKASFDWLIGNDTNALKIYEGKYT
jgi:hypothetical protein